MEPGEYIVIQDLLNKGIITQEQIDEVRRIQKEQEDTKISTKIPKKWQTLSHISSEAKKTDVQIVEPGKTITVNEKDLQKMIAHEIINVEKKDYRATLNLNTNQQQVPDAMTAMIDIDEQKQNGFGFNRELDVKGTINPFQLYFSQTARFAQALSELENWEYVVRMNEKGEPEKIPIDLMSLESEEMRWLSLALFGQQSEKEIRLMRAGFGLNEETMMDKGARWFGLVKKKKSEVYGNQYQGGEQR